MVKVDWHLWAFASGKNVKIWAAASVWSLARRENERLRDVIEAIHMKKNAVQNTSEGNQVAIPSRTLKVPPQSKFTANTCCLCKRQYFMRKQSGLEFVLCV
jgi:hypothetical protein